LGNKKKSEFYIEFRVVWPDKTVHNLATRAKIIRDKKGNVLKLAGVNIDITDRKRVENNLNFLSEVSKVLSSTLDYKKVLNHIAKLSVPELADWCAISMKTKTGIEQVSVAHVDPLKVKWAKELNKTNPPDPNAPTGVPNILRTGKAELYPYISEELILKSAKAPEELQLLRELRFSSAMLLPILVDKKTIGVITFIFSESERHYKQSDLIFAEEIASRAATAIQNAMLYEAAQENEKKFKSFVDSNIVGVFTAEKDGTIKECNDGFLKIIGYTREEMFQKKLNRWKLTPAEYKEVDEKAMKSINSNNSTVPWEKEYIKKDGSQVPVIVGSTLINQITGENITIVLDITERKRLEQRKDEFIGIASHELKTPLTSIKGYTQILERIILQMGDEKLKNYLKKTNIYINRLDSLIADLLDVSRIQAGKLQFNMVEFNLTNLISDSIEAIQPTSTKHTILCNECPDITVYGDLHRLEQVFMNLLSNAIKYSPDSEKVEIEIKKIEDTIQVSVKDYGLGIPKKNLSQLFERFYRVEKTSKQFSGLGIGLYISMEIISRHGGTIKVESEEGKGSSFLVTIPIRQPQNG
jgi:PAS domain S-box-containing protein